MRIRTRVIMWGSKLACYEKQVERERERRTVIILPSQLTLTK